MYATQLYKIKKQVAKIRVGRQPLRVLLITYVITLAAVRLFVLMNPTFQVWANGFHLHHYHLGFLLIAIGSAIPLYHRCVRHSVAMALLIGGGLGLVIDETGLILTLGVDYWSPLTIPVSVAMGAVLFGLQTMRDPESPKDCAAPEVSSFWELPFLGVVSSYACGFILTRSFTTLFPTLQLWVGDIHIQHFTLGFLLLLLCGMIPLLKPESISMRLAGMYGLGFSLIVDQLGELLTENDYWSPVVYPLFFTFLAIHAGIAGYTVYKNRGRLAGG